jgi:hypothetical protein
VSALSTLKGHLDEIVRIDNQIRDLVRGRKVLTLEDIKLFRQLKDGHRYHVRVIQNSKP